MKRNTVIMGLVILIPLLSCCKLRKDEESTCPFQFVEIDVTKMGDCDSWNRVIKDIDFVRLETTDSCIIDNIRAIALSHDRIALVSQKNRTFIFDNNGKLIRNISNRGKGAFELIRPIDVCISMAGRIYILDSGKIIEYDKNGAPLAEIYLGNNSIETGMTTNFYVYKNDEIFTWHNAIPTNIPNKRFHLLLRDNNGNVKSQYIKYQHFSFGVEGRFAQSGINEISITPPSLQDTIFAIIDGVVTPKFILKIIQNKIEQNIPPLVGESNNDFQYPNQLLEYQAKYELYRLTDNVTYNSNYLIFSLNKDGKVFRVNYDLINKSCNIFECYYQSSLTNIFTPGNILCSYDNKFYASLEAWKIRLALDEKLTSSTCLSENRRIELLNKLKDVKETDNPVLMIITTKNQTNEER